MRLCFLSKNVWDNQEADRGMDSIFRRLQTKSGVQTV